MALRLPRSKKAAEAVTETPAVKSTRSRKPATTPAPDKVDAPDTVTAPVVDDTPAKPKAVRAYGPNHDQEW